MAWTRNDAIAAETYYADRYGIPAALAHAIAQIESGHDPYAKGDYVNGVATSFGDYQLHRGGELGSLSEAQADNPYTNARVALGELAAVIRGHPNVHDPGTLAAMAQRPANPSAYAAEVNQILHTAPAGGTSSAGVQDAGVFTHPGGSPIPLPNVTGGASWLWSHSGGWVLHGAGDAASLVAAPFVAIYNLLRGVWDFFTSEKTWIRVGLFAGGFLLLFVGAKVALGGGGGGMPMPIPV